MAFLFGHHVPILSSQHPELEAFNFSTQPIAALPPWPPAVESRRFGNQDEKIRRDEMRRF